MGKLISKPNDVYTIARGNIPDESTATEYGWRRVADVA